MSENSRGILLSKRGREGEIGLGNPVRRARYGTRGEGGGHGRDCDRHFLRRIGQRPKGLLGFCGMPLPRLPAS